MSSRIAPASKKILVVGATGKQGGAVIDALKGSNFQIIALTRSATSGGALKLAGQPNITVFEGDSSKPGPIFDAHKPIHGVFGVTVMGKLGEEEQGKPLIDAAILNNVEHFVFTSVDRGGEKSETNPTNIPHFITKHNLENYLKAQIKAKGSTMQWTILRPTAFMDNLSPNFAGKGFASMWAGVGKKPLQLVSTRDIGIFAARAFNNPAAYNGRAISLAGDELNFEQGKKVFKDTIGSPIPETFSFVGSSLKFMIKELGTMFKWFADEGYGADIQSLRKEEPKLQTFSQWLSESSGFKK